MSTTNLVTRDPGTGLRYSPTYWTKTGEIPSPDGCRWCGHRQRGHLQMWRASVHWHAWAQPTGAQRLARMKARRSRAEGSSHPRTPAPEQCYVTLEVKMP